MPAAAPPLAACQHRLCLQGQAVEIDCDVPGLNWPIHSAVGAFASDDWPDGFSPLSGSIRAYDESVVTRHLSPSATAVNTGDSLIEVYEHGERFWLIDDRWGLCEINFIQNQWKGWIVPQPRASAVEMVDWAVLWPMAQLAVHKGLTLLPAVGVARRDFGALLISPFGIEPELKALMNAGWRVVGPRWIALRDDDGRVAMLHMPGIIQGCLAARHDTATIEPAEPWIDLTRYQAETRQHHAFCDAVVLVDAARRGSVRVKPLQGPGVGMTLRRAWPMFDLRPAPRAAQMQSRLAADCSLFEAQLSRRPDEFAMAMDRVTAERAPKPGRVQMQIMPASRPRLISA